eukprot:m.73944 g.73944  ORF g.73944 m.73944 type:complete len:691 (+) comp14395_c0_seq2:114-2186(+)
MAEEQQAVAAAAGDDLAGVVQTAAAAAAASAAAPSVDSEVQADRIAARRSRMKARAEAAARGEFEREASDEPEAPTQLDPVPKSSIAKVAASRKELDALRDQGTEKVSLVRVVANLAENKRRKAERAKEVARRKLLEREKQHSDKIFDEVVSKWEKAMGKSRASELHTSLEQQRELCNQVVSSKDQVIKELQAELRRRDDDYVKDLRSQAADVENMLTAMDEQIDVLSKEYRVQLEGIENTFMEERAELISAARKEWDEAMKRRRDTEVECLQHQEHMLDEHDGSLDHLRITDSEEYKAVKIKLETEIQQLEQQLQQMKATYQLNVEKLEYNYQVLKKRDEENTQTITQQKRRINRVSDALNQLRKRVAKQEKSLQEQNGTLTEDYNRIAEQFQDVQSKFMHFQTLDAKRFEEVWSMNEETCTALTQKALMADKILCEQQLGLQWVPPVEDLFDSSARSKRIPLTKTSRERAAATNDPIAAVAPETIKRALGLLCDEGGFLVESKLTRLVASLPKSDQSLIKLDSIFKALGVESEKDIARLAHYFVVKDEDGSVPEQAELIDKNDVLPALRNFVADQRKLKGLDRETPKGLGAEHGKRPEFWGDLLAAVPESHDRAWTALQDGLEKYHGVLTARSKSIVRCEELQQQNAELRSLLHQYMSSPANDNLVIPPTMVISGQMAGRLGHQEARQ